MEELCQIDYIPEEGQVMSTEMSRFKKNKKKTHKNSQAKDAHVAN